MKTALSEKIVCLRKRMDLNQLDFSVLMGANQSMVSFWETGKSIPDDKKMKMLKRYMDNYRIV